MGKLKKYEYSVISGQKEDISLYFPLSMSQEEICSFLQAFKSNYNRLIRLNDESIVGIEMNMKDLYFRDE